MVNRFPYLSLAQSLVVLRISVAIVFLAHAIVRIFNGTIPRFGGFMEHKGFVPGEWYVWAITIFEIGGGTLLMLGCFIKLLSAGFILILLVGIVLIHAQLGWFVGEHGDGGIEYSFILIVALLVIMAEKNRVKTPDKNLIK